VVSIAPEEATSHFGWMARLITDGIPATSLKTRQKLSWHPSGPGLLSDLENMNYSAV
jgi:hypothetical protein